MRYTVLWTPQAESDLARLWNTHLDRAAIAKASDAIDVLLRDDPQNVGESRAGVARVVVVEPLTAHFVILQDDRVVEVVDIRYFARRHKL